ncbi:MAG: phage capsid protein, partial [Acidimicrobiia bacterium]
FASQITEPQVTSVATGAEDKLATAINDEAVDIEFALTETEADTVDTILEARELLGEADVPASDRFLAVSPSIATRLLNVEKFTKVNESGGESALRDAILGRIYGFTVVESNGLTADTAMAYHRSGIVFASKKPADPRGAVESFAISQDGINIRQIFQYDPDVLSDASVLSTFAGASMVFEDADDSVPADSERWVKIGVAST